MGQKELDKKKALEKYAFATADGKPFEIPSEGCLGLLALGDIGLLAWRKKRRKEKGLFTGAGFLSSESNNR